MSVACSGASVSQCMAATGSGSTFAVTETLLKGGMWSAAFIFVLFVVVASYQGLGSDKVTYYSMFKSIITAIVMCLGMLMVVQAIIR